MLIKVCEKCGKRKNTNISTDEKCKCGGDLKIIAQQQGAKKGWEIARQ